MRVDPAKSTEKGARSTTFLTRPRKTSLVCVSVAHHFATRLPGPRYTLSLVPAKLRCATVLNNLRNGAPVKVVVNLFDPVQGQVLKLCPVGQET